MREEFRRIKSAAGKKRGGNIASLSFRRTWGATRGFWKTGNRGSD